MLSLLVDSSHLASRLSHGLASANKRSTLQSRALAAHQLLPQQAELHPGNNLSQSCLHTRYRTKHPGSPLRRSHRR
ncbi:hypothetical protein D9M68_134880 [compost metagenome]